MGVHMDGAITRPTHAADADVVGISGRLHKHQATVVYNGNIGITDVALAVKT